MSTQSRTSRRRRGISLLEVLISMFVLAVGLMGVAALIPAGQHEIVEAAKLDNAAMLGRAAFRDMQVRGYLNPNGWRYSPTGATIQSTNRAIRPNRSTIRGTNHVNLTQARWRPTALTRWG